MELSQNKLCSVKDIYALPDGQRAELIEGKMYMMVPPIRLHHHLVMNISALIHDYINTKNGSCLVYPAPFAVFLNADDRNYVEPDISVICDRDKLDNRGCVGAPDWIIEITSPSTGRLDYGMKLFKYRAAGVREYWIVNPDTRTVNVCDFEQEKGTNQYSFENTISACIYEDLNIKIADLLPSE